MGVWGANTSVGAILGTVIPAALLQYGWGYSCLVPAFIMALIALLVFLVCVICTMDMAGIGHALLTRADPRHVGLPDLEHVS